MLIELFAGAGGMSAGAHNVGAHGVGIEWDANACATRRANMLPTIFADVRHHHPTDFPDASILAGGPPCQTFSEAGDGSGRAEIADVIATIDRMSNGRITDPLSFTDERTALILEPLRWILEADRLERPYEAVVLEQVPTALPVWEAYAAVLERRGYSVAVGVLHTEQYGIPQTRRRACLVARADGPASLPTPTHRGYRKGVPQHEGDPDLKPWVSMGEVIRWGQPFEVISNYGTGGDPKKRGRRTSAEPAFTVTGKISRLRLVAPDGAELPRLTADEAGELQGFGGGWKWAGNDIAQQVGNACPPPLAAALLGAVIAA